MVFSIKGRNESREEQYLDNTKYTTPGQWVDLVQKEVSVTVEWPSARPEVTSGGHYLRWGQRDDTWGRPGVVNTSSSVT